jgi:hypothetical protein
VEPFSIALALQMDWEYHAKAGIFPDDPVGGHRLTCGTPHVENTADNEVGRSRGDVMTPPANRAAVIAAA